MASYAIIIDGIVDNIAVWDGVTPWAPGNNGDAILAPDDCAIGWAYDGAQFIPPVLALPPISNAIANNNPAVAP
jgi:hypothetical protein